MLAWRKDGDEVSAGPALTRWRGYGPSRRGLGCSAFCVDGFPGLGHVPGSLGSVPCVSFRFVVKPPVAWLRGGIAWLEFDGKQGVPGSLLRGAEGVGQFDGGPDGQLGFLGRVVMPERWVVLGIRDSLGL